MQHYCYKRLRQQVIFGNVDIPVGAILQSDDETHLIKYQNKPMCFVTSQLSHDHFVTNQDGKGARRGSLVNKIETILRADKKKWEPLWEDEIALSYKFNDIEDYFLWSDDFYNNSKICDLEHILELIKK